MDQVVINIDGTESFIECVKRLALNRIGFISNYEYEQDIECDLYQIIIEETNYDVIQEMLKSIPLIDVQ